MDSPQQDDLIQNYEKMFKARSCNQTLALYSDSNINSLNSGINKTPSVKEIIKNVTTQVRAFQNADCLKSGKTTSKSLNEYKKSSFIPVNMFAIYDRKQEEIKNKNVNKFETQCVSDTQLIDLMDNAEALIDSNKEISHEFDTAFDIKTEENNEIFKIEEEFDKESLRSPEIPPIRNISLSEMNSSSSQFSQNILCGANCTQLLNETIEIEPKRQVVIDQNEDLNLESLKICKDSDSRPLFNINDDDIPSSYGFSSIRSKSKTPSPLVFNLEMFESFENKAASLLKPVDTSTEISPESLKLNVQEIQPETLEIKEQLSPVLKLSARRKSAKSKNDHNITPNVSTEENKPKIINIQYEDEILFSSDEEQDILNKDTGDLPFTCALETSFYEQSGVLDKTMYVGFQTASCKSIQVSCESFERAKSIFVDLNVNQKPFKDLVDICDSLTFKDKEVVAKEITENVNKSPFWRMESEFRFHETDTKIDSKTTECKDYKEDEKDNYEIEFVSRNINDAIPQLKILSNNVINLSEKENRTVFQNINVNETLRKSNKVIVNQPCVEIKLETNITSEILEENTKLEEEFLKEFDNPNIQNLNNLNTQPVLKVEEFVGFKTASDKNINISDKALAKYQNIFQDVDISDDFKVLNESESFDKQNDMQNTKTTKFVDESKTVGFNGFKTASNKNIIISGQALGKMKAIFRDIDKIDQLEESHNEKYNKGEFYPTSNIKKDSEDLSTETTDKANDYPNVNDHIMEDSLRYCFDSEFVFQDDDLNKNALDPAKTMEEICEKKFFISEHKKNEDLVFKIPDAVAFETVSNKKFIVTAKEMEKCTKVFDVAVTKNNEFVGFKTASNNKIDISSQALMRSYEIFEGINDQHTVENSAKECYKIDDPTKSNIFDGILKDNITSFQGFQTASNKKVTISAEALAKSKKIFEDINNTDVNKQITESTYSSTTCTTIKKYPDNPEEISSNDGFNEYMIKNKQKLESKKDHVKNNNQIHIANMSQSYETDVEFKGFQTASNKRITISNDALIKSKKLFENIDDIPINAEPEKEHFEGFKTASKKEVKISAEALAKSRKLFEDIESNPKNHNIDTERENIFNGFQTASNKKVDISEKALIKSRKLFEDIDNNINNFVPNEIPTHEDIPREIIFKGFQTASKKEVPISEAALAKSRELFKEINEQNNENFDVSSENSNSLKGYRMANNKGVNVSKTASASVKTLFEEIENKEITFKHTEFKGFQTASKKVVKVSDEAVAESRKIFNDIDKTSFKIAELLCFQTASHKGVTVSKDVLKMSSKIHDIDENYLIKDIPDEEPIFRGFKTGNDSKVNISVEALERSKKKFSEFNPFDVEKSKDRASQYSKVKNNIEEIIDTQVINDFDDTLNTEDFHKATPKVSKRSGSPILSCPKAKRRKIFSTPYNTNPSKRIIRTTNEKQNENAIVFNENYKKIKKLTYKNLPKSKTIDKSLMNIDFDTILNFEFQGTRNEMASNVWTIDSIKEAFLNSVNRKFVPEGWLDNHLRLILWKLISYEIRFCIQQVCTVKNVLEQLKYRYDKELYKAERPAIRRILERDDTSMKTMVLCVVHIYSDGVKVSRATNTTNTELLLTDGWYCIKATIDNMLSKLVYDGKIVVGSKIATHGAELINCEQGMAPWENTSAVRLKLFGNSTRPAVWDARLGYHGNAAILSQLSSVKVEGGKVSRLRVRVVRVYPTLYVEKFDDGSTVTRSERLENIHQMKHETDRQNLLEKLYEEVEKEISDQESEDSEPFDSSNKRRHLDSGSQISKLMNKSGDPSEFRLRLTESQSRLLDNHTAKQREKLLENIQTKVQDKLKRNALYANRNVVSLLKTRVASVEQRNGGVEIYKAMLSIWKPNDDILEIIKEGSWIEVMNVVPTAIRYSEIQISASRQSLFRLSKYKEDDNIKPYTQSLKRTCFKISELAQNAAVTTNYNEIDTVGLIFQIDPPTQYFNPKTQPFQNVYITDADKNIICINFWGGIKKFGFENVLNVSEIVTCVNLQKRAGNTRKNIPQYRVTEFTYFSKTPKHVDARKIVDLLTTQFADIDRRKFCCDCVAIKNNHFALRQHVENISPYRINQSEYNISRNKMFIDSPLVVKNEDFNLSGLDFESSFQTELSPQALRKNKTKEKIAKLKMYGEPPPLSPIFIKNISKNATSAYRSPFQNDSNVASTENASGPKSVEKSPVLLSRGIRKHGNPVKLNFSTCKDDTIDHFAEDFEASPPLSLDSDDV